MNLFWPSYKRLENEIVLMTSEIKFDDNQLDVYSDKLLELLIRISIEIEAISKELYLGNGGEDDIPESKMYFDTLCLQLLEEKWNLGKKCVLVDGLYFSFEEEENRVITPLYKANKRGTSGAKWKQAYQAVKHNRSKNYKQGNIRNCLQALAALYILNIYYKDEKYELNSINEANSFDQSLGSEIFSVLISKNKSLNGKINIDEKSVYCINYTKEFRKKWSEKQTELNVLIYKEIVKQKEIVNEISSGKMSLEELSNIEKVQEVMGPEKFTDLIKEASRKNNMVPLLMNQEFYAYLNKEC